jgi:hypothetical protein
MGLCLHVFGSDVGDDEEPEEIAWCDVGHYSDFACFRDTIARYLDADRCPTLMQHSDCDGEWTLAEISLLEQELREIGAAFQKLPPEERSIRAYREAPGRCQVAVRLLSQRGRRKPVRSHPETLCGGPRAEATDHVHVAVELYLGFIKGRLQAGIARSHRRSYHSIMYYSYFRYDPILEGYLMSKQPHSEPARGVSGWG